MDRAWSIAARQGIGVLACLVLVLVGGIAFADAGSYTDAASIPDWAQADVALTSQFRVFRGDASGTFRPDSAISRAEFTAILMRAFSLRPDPAVTVPFTDIAGGWYTDVITQAVQTGVIQAGDFPAQFGPNQPINRAQMARMVARAVDARRVIFTPGLTLSFSDVPASDPFHAAITKATSYGIIKGMGDGTFVPGATATRAQAAVMIARAMRLGKPMEPEVEAKLYKGVVTGVYNVFTGAVELAAARPPGTKTNLDSLSNWLAPEAQEKLTNIVDRDISGFQQSGFTGWWEEPSIFIGEDHAILSGRLAGVPGQLNLPVQRQFNGAWRIVDIPAISIDASRLEEAQPTTVSLTYTDTAGVYFDVEYEVGDVSRYLDVLGAKDWGKGTVRIVRIGGRPWEQTAHSVAVAALHAKLDGKGSAALHYLVVSNGGGPVVTTYSTDLDFAAAVTGMVMKSSMIHSVDGLPWEYIAEAPYFRSIINDAPQGSRSSLDLVVRSNPTRWVPEFLSTLNHASKTSNAAR